jgi:threonine/homoserine/homoserine lactone efflux protein
MNWSRSTCNTHRATLHFYPHPAAVFIALGLRRPSRAYLGAQAIRSAIRGRYAPLDREEQSTAASLAGWRQGFISNITNPKVLVFYLAVLPQFLTPGANLGWLLVLAWSHALLSLGYLLVLVTGLHSAQRLLTRRNVRRGLDATTGAVLLGFSAKLATEHV